jgi:hypothetical protein
MPLDDLHRFCLKRLDTARSSDYFIEIGLILSYIQDTALEFEKSCCRVLGSQGPDPRG